MVSGHSILLTAIFFFHFLRGVLGGDDPVSIFRKDDFNLLRDCAKCCFKYACWHGNDGSSNFLSGLLSCDSSRIDSCFCREDLQVTAVSHLSTCVQASCGKTVPDITSAVAVYTNYCKSTGIITSFTITEDSTTEPTPTLQPTTELSSAPEPTLEPTSESTPTPTEETASRISDPDSSRISESVSSSESTLSTLISSSPSTILVSVTSYETEIITLPPPSSTAAPAPTLPNNPQLNIRPGLSAGGIAGMVIGSVVAIAGIATTIILILRKRKAVQPVTHPFHVNPIAEEVYDVNRPVG
ncbi:uncharacterized protein DFL_007948 [Arthrobotrys flagrans]|uniref:Extracellular membrane protein CFEM domain-containing protein n=1 Tax=Arthrobotrys flagrans TaxID=97331 RepID=A0A436ZX56_ARTFL|nr:hypothetical protein DFL_007948 [Arthrobotrys flagrans]